MNNLRFFAYFNLVVLFVFPEEQMKIHAYYTNLWQEDKIPLEYPVYKLLKQNPIKKNIHYLAVPWGVLITSNKLNLIPKIKLPGGFTVTRSTRFREIIPLLKKIGIDVLFTPHATGEEYTGIKVLPIQHYNLNGVAPAKNKNIFYSFVGCTGNALREKIFGMKHPKESVVIRRSGLYYYNSEVRKETEKREYQDILARSRFALCPRGYGPGTLRFWEALQAGAIPVVITDKLVLPAGFDWSSCVVMLAEENLPKLPEILKLITKQKEEEMRKSCLKAAKLFSNNNLLKVIKDYYSA